MIQIGNSYIINADVKTRNNTLPSGTLYPITCGLSVRSTVTASSISEDGFIYCLQRSIFNINGIEISPQEFKVSWQTKPVDIYPYLEFVTLLLLCNVSSENISKIMF